MSEKKTSKNKYKKEYFIVLTILGVLLAALIIGIGIQTSKPYTLAKVINEFNKLDKKYNTSWRQEKICFTCIDGMITSIDKIDNYINDINKIEDLIKKQNITEKRKVYHTQTLMLNLTLARKLMLEAEKKYQEFQLLGDKGKIDFEYDDFDNIKLIEEKNCEDKTILIEGARLLNETIQIINKVRYSLDIVLNGAEETRSPELIGVNENKPKFYKSKSRDLMDQMNVNLIMAKLC